MRLKTGTPPRIYTQSIDYNILDPQPSENNGIFLSYFTKQNTNKILIVILLRLIIKHIK